MLPRSSYRSILLFSMVLDVSFAQFYVQSVGACCLTCCVIRFYNLMFNISLVMSNRSCCWQLAYNQTVQKHAVRPCLTIKFHSICFAMVCHIKYERAECLPSSCFTSAATSSWFLSPVSICRFRCLSHFIWLSLTLSISPSINQPPIYPVRVKWK